MPEYWPSPEIISLGAIDRHDQALNYRLARAGLPGVGAIGRIGRLNVSAPSHFLQQAISTTPDPQVGYTPDNPTLFLVDMHYL